MGDAPGNRISAALDELRRTGRRGVLPLICGGHPQPGATGLVLPALERAGAPIVEVALPFAATLAGGAGLAAAMHRALSKGASVRGVLDEIASLREWMRVGLVAQVSVASAFAMGGAQGVRGGAKMADALARAGFDGVLYADLPLEEAPDWMRAAGDAGLVTTMQISVGTSLARAEEIAKLCTGYVSVLARGSSVGQSKDVPTAAAMISKLKQCTSLPIAAGVRVASSDDVRALVRPGDEAGATLALVDEAIVKVMGEAGERGGDAVQAAESRLAELSRGLTGSFGERSEAGQAIQQSA